MSVSEEKKSDLFQRLVKKTDVELGAIQVDYMRVKQALGEIERSLQQLTTVIADAEQSLRNAAQNITEIPLESITAVRDFIVEKRNEYTQRESEQEKTQKLLDRINRSLREKMLEKKAFEKIMLKHKKKSIQKTNDRNAREIESLWANKREEFYG